jgi:hypothetical protein
MGVMIPTGNVVDMTLTKSVSERRYVQKYQRRRVDIPEVAGK